MAITKKKIHNLCTVGVEWLEPDHMAYAKLVCVDSNCTHKKKFVQWLSLDDAVVLVEDLGITEINDPIPLEMVDLKELGI